MLHADVYCSQSHNTTQQSQDESGTKITSQKPALSWFNPSMAAAEPTQSNDFAEMGRNLQSDTKPLSHDHIAAARLPSRPAMPVDGLNTCWGTKVPRKVTGTLTQLLHRVECMSIACGTATSRYSAAAGYLLVMSCSKVDDTGLPMPYRGSHLQLHVKCLLLVKVRPRSHFCSGLR